MQGLVDTGNKMTCLSGKVFDQYAHKWKEFPALPLVGVRAIGFTGEKSMILKRQIQLLIVLVEISSEFKFLIICRIV